MRFDWTEEEKKLFEAARTWAADVIAPSCAQREADAFFEGEQWALCAEGGFLGACVPAEFGGRGENLLQTARMFEAYAIGCSDMGLGFASAAHLLACSMAISFYGSDEIKRGYLPGLCNGDRIGANAITEEGAGSDAFSLALTAEERDDCYRLNGKKSFITNGPIADVFVVYAKTKPDMGFFGISAFLVDAGSEGLTVGAALPKMGLKSAPASEATFVDCKVPKGHLLGDDGQGSMIFTRCMEWERGALFGLFIGMLERQLDRLIAHVKERKQFGKRLGKHQAVGHRIADMKLRLESARLMLYNACWHYDQGDRSALNISLSKMAIAEASIKSTLDFIHLMGSKGFIESEFAFNLWDAIGASIASGTEEMLKDLVARELGIS